MPSSESVVWFLRRILYPSFDDVKVVCPSIVTVFVFPVSATFDVASRFTDCFHVSPAEIPSTYCLVAACRACSGSA